MFFIPRQSWMLSSHWFLQWIMAWPTMCGGGNYIARRIYTINVPICMFLVYLNGLITHLNPQYQTLRTNFILGSKSGMLPVLRMILQLVCSQNN